MTVTSTAALNIYMIRIALIIGIVNTFYGFTVYAYGLAGVGHGTLKRLPAFPFLNKALTAGIVTIAGMFSAHHNVSFAAKAILIIGTILYRTF